MGCFTVLDTFVTVLLFYHAYAKPWINYGILIYGSAAETNLGKIGNTHRSTMRTVFFKRRQDPLTEILMKNGILAVFELNFAEFLKELFQQLRLEAPNQYLPQSLPSSNLSELRNEKGLLQSKYCRTIINKKSIENLLRKAYNWLTELRLLLSELKTMTKSPPKAKPPKTCFFIRNRE